MDWNALKEKGSAVFSKYKYVLLVVFIGIVLMSMPTGAGDEAATAEPAAPVSISTAQELEQILAQIEGVGKVRVMLTESCGALTEYQTDQDRTSDGGLRVETVIVRTQSRENAGLLQSDAPAT